MTPQSGGRHTLLHIVNKWILLPTCCLPATCLSPTMNSQPRSILKSSRVPSTTTKSVTWAELPTPELNHMARYLLKSLKPAKKDKILPTSSKGLKRPRAESEDRSSRSLKRLKSFKSSAEFNLEVAPEAGVLTFGDIFSGTLSPSKSSPLKSPADFDRTPQDTECILGDIFSGNWSPRKLNDHSYSTNIGSFQSHKSSRKSWTSYQIS